MLRHTLFDYGPLLLFCSILLFWASFAIVPWKQRTRLLVVKEPDGFYIHYRVYWDELYLLVILAVAAMICSTLLFDFGEWAWWLLFPMLSVTVRHTLLLDLLDGVASRRLQRASVAFGNLFQEVKRKR